MSSVEISLIVFGFVFGGALLGMLLRRLLPEHHLSSESKDVVKLGMGLIATMAALVLSLLIASAKSTFDAQRAELSQLSSNVIMLDRVLAHYGPEAQSARETLRQAVVKAIDRIWSQSSPESGPSGSERLYDNIQMLTPKNDSQRTLQSQAINIAIDLGRTRWLMFAQKGSSIPVPFLAVLVFWLAMLFASFSLFARPNLTIVCTLLICALSVSGAIYLVLELDRPFSGLIQISSAPLKGALEQMGK
jgi:hypothetical protein